MYTESESSKTIYHDIYVQPIVSPNWQWQLYMIPTFYWYGALEELSYRHNIFTTKSRWQAGEKMMLVVGSNKKL